MDRIKTICFHTFGCKVNQADTEEIFEKLRDKLKIVNTKTNADYFIINTCTVTERADSKFLQLIRQIKKRSGKTKIIIIGCLPSVNKEIKIDHVCKIFSNNEYDSLIEFITGDSNLKNIPISKSKKELFRTRAFVKVQDGCDSFCSYCIVPFARGRSRSIPSNIVLEKINKKINGGYKEIVLTGIHLGNYGKDFKEKESLSNLIKKIIPHLTNTRLRISSIEPNEITEEFTYLLKNDKICKHIHLPLESGNDATLNRMNRHYTRKFFYYLIKNLKKEIPELAIGVDIIVGFPGEQDTEFNDTLNLVQELPLSYGHVFAYSDRTKTRSINFPNKISQEVKIQRSKILRTIFNQKRLDFYKDQAKNNLEILVEEKSKNNLFLKGFSSNYIPTYVKFDKSIVNKFVIVEAKDVRDKGILGEVKRVL
jgi:threonylcarbamoyladenosine tRNA methylthiotransferase MtaB